ncbi:MAG: arylsulfatase A-like enzyme, partial [Pseudohongiellaceae bacterium]
TDKPFLLFLHYNDVHSDYIPPAPFDRQHNPDYAGTLTAEDYPRNKRVNRQMEPADLAWVESLYDGEISWVDQHIGKVLAHLDSLKLTDNTIVVVTADHGEGFFEHNGKEHHYGLYDELVNIPFLVKWPARVGAGQRIAHGVSQTDVPLTILGLAGVEGLPEADGISWGRLLTEGTGPRPRPLLSKAILKPILDEDGDLLLALRTDKLTVIRQTTPEGVVTAKVFARQSDPGETSPLAQSHPDYSRGLQLLELLESRMNSRRDSLDWSDTELVQDADPELLEQMRQFGYIK